MRRGHACTKYDPAPHTARTPVSSASCGRMEAYPDDFRERISRAFAAFLVLLLLLAL